MTANVPMAPAGSVEPGWQVLVDDTCWVDVVMTVETEVPGAADHTVRLHLRGRTTPVTAGLRQEIPARERPSR